VATVSRLDDALELVAIDSVSRGEAAIAHHVAVVPRTCPDLDVERIGDNVVARNDGHHAHTTLGRGSPRYGARRRAFGHDRGRRTGASARAT